MLQLYNYSYIIRKYICNMQYNIFAKVFLSKIIELEWVKQEIEPNNIFWDSID